MLGRVPNETTRLFRNIICGVNKVCFIPLTTCDKNKYLNYLQNNIINISKINSSANFITNLTKNVI